MDTAIRYFAHLQSKFQEILDHELPNIEKAAELVAESCRRGGKFYVFGTGHSHMIAEELYLRAGGLALVHAILPPEMMLHEMPNKSTYLERLEGYAKAMVELYRLDEKDTIMVISNSGRNAVPLEMCLEAKKKGAAVIAMTSMRHSSSCTSRHSSGKKMYEVADVTIDNCAEPVWFRRCSKAPMWTAVTSTTAGCLQSITVTGNKGTKSPAAAVGLFFCFSIDSRRKN